MSYSKPLSACVDTGVMKLHYLEWSAERLSSPPSPQHTECDTLPIVLLHALCSTADSWSLVARYLAARHPLVALDLRGHGQSAQPESGYDMASLAEDIVHGMAYLGLGQVALVGHGWGARVALVIAARHPALISHLVLVDCPLVEPRYWPGMTRESFIQERLPDQHLHSREAYLALYRGMLGPEWSVDIEEIVLRAVIEGPDGQLREVLPAAQQQRIREALWDDRALTYYSKLVCPVLLVPAAHEPEEVGSVPQQLLNAQDFAVAKGYMAAQVARLIQNCIIHWMPNTIHDIHLQRPQELAQIIAHFVRTS